MPKSQCADLVSRLAPTLKSALVGVQSSQGELWIRRGESGRGGIGRECFVRDQPRLFLIGAKLG